ncbi:MAG TPA: N-acyl homoserine lactonase family protein [Terriglobia bacterium]|nr:N-acyl homoserine lactonase family protein [Terriglobia bacterium]
MRMIRSALTFVLAIAVLVLTACQADPGLKLYVFDCGNLKSSNPAILQERGVTTTDMSVAAYLIVHPRGTLLWDAGVIPDELIKPEGTTVFRATASKTLQGQLAEIGYKPSDVTYLALSHYHYDHSANSNTFAGSTWLVHKPERDLMFSGNLGPSSANSPAPETTMSRFAALRDSKTTLIEGDYDVFGDGSVVIVATPGHTPGHQSLLVNLPKTGPVILSGDLYHYPAERELKDFTPFAALGDPAVEELSKAKIETLIEKKHARLWIQHDLIANRELKKSPAFYD